MSESKNESMSKNNEKLTFFWRQEGQKAIVSYPKGEVYFDMPKEWSLDKTHPDLLVLASYLLFDTSYPINFEGYNFTRKQRKKIGLAFSGGIDSTAAMCLLPKDKTELFYHQREGFKVTSMRQDNALHMFDNMERKVWKIKSNQEIINEREGKRRGFSTDYCVGIGLILMADILDLGYFATGQMMESTHLRRGYKFRDFETCKFWRTFEPIFRKVGLPILGPVFGCSEVVTSNIVQQTEYKDLAQSCVRGVDSKPCNDCYKCFRKNIIKGVYNPMDTPEINYILTTRPLKQAASLIYTMNKHKFDIPLIKEYKNLNLEFVERYYTPVLELLPKDIRQVVQENLDKYGIKPMTQEMITEMEELDLTK